MTRLTSYFFVCALLAVSTVSSSFAQSAGPQPLIIQRVDGSQLVTLKGNVHPLAQSLTDLGVASPNLVMHRMLLVLNHSPAQESALNRLMDEQQEKESANYHQWLTPDQFGQQFGASIEDIQTIGAWLQSNGFQVTQVSRGRNVIEFSGTAAQVQQAFHTSIHSYLGSDGPHWANASDPQIPAALAPAIAGIDSLNNFPRKAANRFAGVYSMSSRSMTSRPQFTVGCGFDQNNQPITCYAISPYDFATIYNVLPLWTAATDGTGETIAVVGRSNINTQDVAAFRSTFNLPPADVQHLNIILNGPDPGLNFDESEADIDVQWSGAVAKNARIDFVVSQSTETTDGVDLSALYIIDNNLAGILSESFGQCEAFLGATGNAFYRNLWEQASAQGISVFLSTGDSGAAGCDQFQGTVPQPAINGLAVSGLASTPFNVAVGGTDFNDFANPLTYWNAGNDSNNASAKGYIPETTWNDSCTNSIFSTIGFSTNAEANCNDSRILGFIDVIGGSGGASNVYSKPSWQTGAGIPSDGKRDLPDVSLFASDGFVGNFYVICQSDITGGFCDSNSLAGFGGTSVSTPAFAGIMALVNQTMGGVRQGNPNYVLYKLAAANPGAFHDIPAGSTIAMPCLKGSPNCTVNTEHAVGILNGYSTGTGYDLATGLGSVDANVLATSWSSVAGNFKASAVTITDPAPLGITHGQQVSTAITVAAVAPATGTPTGDVSLITSTGQSVGGFTLNAGSVNATTNLLPGGTYTIRAHYAGDGSFGGSDSAPSAAITVAPEASKTSLRMETFDFNGNQVNPNTATAVYGSQYLLRADVTNSSGTACAPLPTGQSACPTGNFALSDNGNPLSGGNFRLNSLGYAEDQFPVIPGGVHTLRAEYAGDESFSASSDSEDITITQATVSFFLLDVPATGNTASPVTLKAIISGQSIGLAPTGTIAFFSDGTQLTGTVTNMVGNDGAITGGVRYEVDFAASFPDTGTHTVTAKYSGDSNYNGADSLPSLSPQITIGGTGNDFRMSIPTILLIDRGILANTILTIAGDSGYTGTINFTANSCSGLPSESNCTFTPSSLTGSGTVKLSVSSALPHALTTTQAENSRRSGWLTLTLGPMFGCMLLAGVTKRKWPYLMALVVFGLVMMAGCGGGSSGFHPPTDRGTPPGTYTVTVTGKSDTNLTHSATFQVVVN